MFQPMVELFPENGWNGADTTNLIILSQEEITMKATLENAIQTVHSMSANYHDETLPLMDMEFDSAAKMWVSGRQVEVLPSAQKLFSNRLRVPYSYLTRCPSDLQARNLNFWLMEEKKKRDTLFCRFDGNRLRAIFTDRYEPTDNMEVLSKMMEYGFSPSQEVRYSLGNEMLAVSVPDHSRAFQVLGKDKIVPGISIANSEVGILALTIDAFFYRLVCSNGLIAKTSVDAKYKHISRRGIENFNIALENVISQSRHAQNSFHISTQTPVSNAIASIETFARQFQLPQAETEIVKQAYFVEEGATMFHIINAFTRAAQFPELAIEASHQLERIGGAILGMVKQ